MGKKTEKIENWILLNLTNVSGIIIVLILVLFFIQPFNIKTIDLQFTLTSIGAIFVFWYGYKTYERNKEIEIIDKYSSKYNEVMFGILTLKNAKEINQDFIYKEYFKLLNLFFEEFYLYKVGYINDKLWAVWSDFIEADILNLLNYYLEGNIENNNDVLTILFFGDNIAIKNNFSFDFIDFIEKIIDNYKIVISKTKIQKKIQRINNFHKLFEEMKKHKKDLIENLKI